MRYAMIMAGGSGTRLWPMSRASMPKQLIPFIHGRSLLQIAMDRLKGLLPAEQIYICAGESHRRVILDTINWIDNERFLGEPEGRDTLNAVGLTAALIGQRDPEATIAVFTADHVIEPVDQFQQIVNQGYEVAEADSNTLVTFGIAPTAATTAYGYLQLGDPYGQSGGRLVDQFKEKPDRQTAEQYLADGPQRYLWNSGMFVWQAATLMRCIEKFVPQNHSGLHQLGKVWATDQRAEQLDRIYRQLPKVSVDYAVMEPTAGDTEFQVVAVPMALSWLDVGSWPAFAKTCQGDDNGNALAAARHLMLDSSNTLVASSDNGHLIATIGCRDMIVIHTPDATLVCPADQAERIKQAYEMVNERYGRELA